MGKRHFYRWLMAGAGAALILAACAGAATPTANNAPAPTAAPAKPTDAPKPTSAPAATAAPAPAVQPTTSASSAEPKVTAAPAASATAQPIPPTDTAVAPQVSQVESRTVELEWPPAMRLGNTEAVRLSLVASAGGYVAKAETDQGKLITQVVSVQHLDGFVTSATALLTGINFDISGDGSPTRDLPQGQPVVWRWSIAAHNTGQHKLVLALSIRQTPSQPSSGTAREYTAFSRALDVQVNDVLGMAAPMAGLLGVMGLVAGGGLSAFALRKRAPRTPSAKEFTPASVLARPNPALQMDMHPGLQLAAKDETLLRAVFRQYSRLMLESEFRSGYSGARTFLALPIRPDGRADAYAIAKIGPRKAIEREYANYETYVKNTLPPVTARIQDAPITVQASADAALRYTFVGSPDAQPMSLRQALQTNPDPACLQKLFSTFGPNWWMQRKPWNFRLAQEYDRMLPAHLVVEPMASAAGEHHAFSGKTPPQDCAAYVGDLVSLSDFAQVEGRPDGKSLSLIGAPSAGQAALRVRWLGDAFKSGAVGRVVATRETMLRDAVKGLELFGLPDPIQALPALLDETVRGTESTIHGDLNLENALVGPGGLIWLIDFANTRLGHTLADFAHIQADIVAHIIAPQNTSAQAVFGLLRDEAHPLLSAVNDIAARCLFNPSDPREYHLAQVMAYVGALKYENLNAHQRHVLYLLAAKILKNDL